jgi:hypothetical protein
MGGYGSTRWGWHSKKDTVEDCLLLNVNQLIQNRKLKDGLHIFGGWEWKNSYSGEVTSSIGYELNTTDSYYCWLRLHYTMKNTQERIDFKVRLVTSRPNFGGLRWWFICPLIINGEACNRRVSKIYSPPSSRYFGCRHCHDLTYTSSQDSDKRVNWLRKNPAALSAIVEGMRSDNISTPNLILALKAMR